MTDQEVPVPSLLWNRINPSLVETQQTGSDGTPIFQVKNQGGTERWVVISSEMEVTGFVTARQGKEYAEKIYAHRQIKEHSNRRTDWKCSCGAVADWYLSESISSLFSRKTYAACNTHLPEALEHMKGRTVKVRKNGD